MGIGALPVNMSDRYHKVADSSLFYAVCTYQRVMPSSTPPRQVSVPLSPTSSYPPMPGGQVVYPAPQPPTFVPVPQSQSSQRLSGPQNKRGMIWQHSYNNVINSCPTAAAVSSN